MEEWTLPHTQQQVYLQTTGIKSISKYFTYFRKIGSKTISRVFNNQIDLFKLQFINGWGWTATVTWESNA